MTIKKPNLLWEEDHVGIKGPIEPGQLHTLDELSKTLLLIDYSYNLPKLEAYIEKLEGRIYELEEHINGAG